MNSPPMPDPVTDRACPCSKNELTASAALFHFTIIRSPPPGPEVRSGSDSTGLAEATRPFMSAIPLLPTVNSVRRCGSWRSYHGSLWFEHGVCQPRLSSLTLILQLAAPRTVAPAMLFNGRKDPRRQGPPGFSHAGHQPSVRLADAMCKPFDSRVCVNRRAVYRLTTAAGVNTAPVSLIF